MSVTLSSNGNFSSGGDNFAGVASALHGVSTALLDGDGASILVPGWGCTLTNLTGVAATAGAGGQRHTRRMHHRTVRRVRVEVELADGATVTALRKAIDETRGGCAPVAWRHPDDSAGEVETAPLWRITEVSDVERGRGGVSATIGVVLEEI
ncbi:MAG: hypothetical protein ACREJO_17995 [Phycisphaerales bacterium]